MRTSAVLATLVVAGLLAVLGSVYLAPAPVPIPQATDLSASLPTPSSTQPATRSSPLSVPIGQKGLDGVKSAEPAEVEIVEPDLPVLKLGATAEPSSRQVTTTTSVPGHPTGDARTGAPALRERASSGDHSSGKDG